MAIAPLHPVLSVLINRWCPHPSPIRCRSYGARSIQLTSYSIKIAPLWGGRSHRCNSPGFASLSPSHPQPQILVVPEH